MLTKEDNELLCRVGPGAPMGEMLRQYWHPVLLSTELPERDCNPIRVRLLGEDLVAFRDSSGRPGMLADHCSHRGASLFFGRNEEGGLRCVYHGWKYDVDGGCIDMPNEPEPLPGDEAGADADDEASPLGAAPRRFKDKVHHVAYPCAERGGVIWCYMGPRKEIPALPDIPWFLVPKGQLFATKRLQENNFVQAIEGGIDTTHASFLHTRLTVDLAMRREKDEKTNRTWGDDEATNKGLSIAMKSKSARFELLDTDYGIMIASRREAGEDEIYWRINQFLFPYYTMPPSHRVVDRNSGQRGGGGGGHAFVPMDDENTITWSFTAKLDRPFTGEEIEHMLEYPNPGLHAGVPKGLLPATSEPMGAFRGIHNKRNDYGLDYELQRTVQFCGIPDRSTQDNAIQESMGPIYDRAQEHLGVADSGVIHMRRRLINSARALDEQGLTPPGVDSASSYCVTGCGFILPKSETWITTADELCRLRPGIDLQVEEIHA